jgi:hypothetical protein
MTLEANVEAHRYAEELYGFAEDCATELKQTWGDHAAILFWRRLFEHADEACTGREPSPIERTVAEVHPMTNEKARLWGQTAEIPFGQHSGSKVDAVPLEYLCWLADQRFIDLLRRYLASPRIQQEIKTTDREEHDR